MKSFPLYIRERYHIRGYPRDEVEGGYIYPLVDPRGLCPKIALCRAGMTDYSQRWSLIHEKRFYACLIMSQSA